jgi:PIN domain
LRPLWVPGSAFAEILADLEELAADDVAARGRSAPALLSVARHVALATTDRAVEEAIRRITFGMQQPDIAAAVPELFQDMTLLAVADLGLLLPMAERALRYAAASRNGATGDAHLVALAWATAGDIWSTDRDFAGTGIASWSTPNPLMALGAERP